MVDVVDVVTEADGPVPGLELDDGIELLHLLPGARARAPGHHGADGPALQRRAVALARRLADIGIDDPDALGIRVDEIHVIGVTADEEIQVALVEAADRLLGRLHGVLARHASRLFLVVGLLRRRVRERYQGGELAGSLSQHGLVLRGQRHRGKKQHPQQSGPAQQQDPCPQFHGTLVYWF